MADCKGLSVDVQKKLQPSDGGVGLPKVIKLKFHDVPLIGPLLYFVCPQKHVSRIKMLKWEDITKFLNTTNETFCDGCRVQHQM